MGEFQSSMATLYQRQNYYEVTLKAEMEQALFKAVDQGSALRSCTACTTGGF